LHRHHARALDPEGWAKELATYVQNLKNQGVQLFAVSAENEPDSCGINSTTSYSAAQLAAWIPYLGAAMKPLGVKVMAPETMNACGFATYFAAIQKSTAAWDAVDIFASHEYGCGTLPVQTVDRRRRQGVLGNRGRHGEGER
jgi:O-glycosyl hydrolase